MPHARLSKDAKECLYTKVPHIEDRVEKCTAPPSENAAEGSYANIGIFSPSPMKVN